ncbi:glutamyl-tRNA reductase [Lacisediminihabitans sp.]|uniref:glutamyl-tRNA reductase n=1 Tax=Lacisediminihabitans sp. TaxID=2787631 RepID=UPI00374D49B5
MFLCLTANHQNASFELLEKLSIGAPRAAGILVQNGDFVTGAVVLATCNRFEAYLEIAEPLATADESVARTVRVISEASGIEAEELTASVRVLQGDDVASHLFAVSAGLESVILGEDEISGQVRRALEEARVAGTTSSGLERLFQRAAHTSRGVKNRTALGGAGRSLVRLALELTSSRIADWAATRVLLVGTGQYAGTTVAALRERGASDLTVFSASGRAPRFALRHGMVATDDLRSAIAEADVVITCTSTSTPVITTTIVEQGRRRIVIDLGLPRNVDPAIAAIPGIELLDLETVSLHAPLEELNATSDARALVSEAVSEHAAQTVEQQLTPAIVALRAHVFGLLDAEIDRARARGDSDGRTEAALRHLAGVLLHTPSVRARELARAGEAASFNEAVVALFGIDLPASTAARPKTDGMLDLLA